MTLTMRTTIWRMPFIERASAGAALAVHALARERKGVETVLRDRRAAGLARAVRAALHPRERAADFLQRVEQTFGDREHAGLLRRRLSAVGEPFLEAHVVGLSRFRVDAHVDELRHQVRPL